MAQRGIIGGIAAGSLAVAGCAAASEFGPGWLIWAAAGGAVFVALGALMSWSQADEALAPAASSKPSPARSTSLPADGTTALIRKLSAGIDAADPLTRGRAYRVSHFAVKVGERLGLSKSELHDIEYAALLHDIGRTALHFDVLTKRGSLNASEQASVRTHPTVGHEILRDVPGLANVATIVLAHHEQPNGRGYPQGLSGDNIPVGSRIIMAISAFDALTSDRPYRPGLSAEVAYEELTSHRDTMFYGDVVDALIDLHRSGELFAGFDEEELALYAQGVYNSKAVENYIATVSQVVPSGVKAAPAEDEGPSVDVPAGLDLDHALESILAPTGTGDRQAS